MSNFASRNVFAALGNDDEEGWNVPKKQQKRNRRKMKNAQPHGQQQPSASRSPVTQPQQQQQVAPTEPAPREPHDNYVQQQTSSTTNWADVDEDKHLFATVPTPTPPNRAEDNDWTDSGRNADGTRVDKNSFQPVKPKSRSTGGDLVWRKIRLNIVQEVVQRGYEESLVEQTLARLESEGKIREIRNSQDHREIMTAAKLVLESAGRLKMEELIYAQNQNQDDGGETDSSEEEDAPAAQPYEQADQPDLPTEFQQTEAPAPQSSTGTTDHAGSAPPEPKQDHAADEEEEEDEEEDEEGSDPAQQTTGTSAPLPSSSDKPSSPVDPTSLSTKDQLILELREWDPTKKDAVFILEQWRMKLGDQSEQHREFTETFFKHNGLEEIIKKICQGNVEASVDRACVGLMEEVMYGQRSSGAYNRSDSYHLWLYGKIQEIATHMNMGEDVEEVERIRDFIVGQCLLNILKVQKKTPPSIRPKFPNEQSPLVQQPFTDRPEDPSSVLWKKAEQASKLLLESYNKMKNHEREVKRVAPTHHDVFRRTYHQVLESVDQRIKRNELESSQQRQSMLQVDQRLQTLLRTYNSKIEPLRTELDQIRANKNSFEQKKRDLERDVRELETQIASMAQQEEAYKLKMQTVEEEIKPQQDNLQQMREEFDFKLSSSRREKNVYESMNKLVTQSYEHLDQWSQQQVQNQSQMMDSIGTNYAQNVVEFLQDQAALLDFIAQRIQFLKKKMEEARSEEAEYRRLGVEAPNQNREWLENLTHTINDDETNKQSILGSIQQVLNKTFQTLASSSNVLNNLFSVLTQSPITKYITLDRFHHQLQILNHQHRQQAAQIQQQFHQTRTQQAPVGPGPRHGGPLQTQQQPLQIVADNPSYNLNSQPATKPSPSGRRAPLSQSRSAAPIGPPASQVVMPPTAAPVHAQAAMAQALPAAPMGQTQAQPQNQQQPSSGPIPVLPTQRSPAKPTATLPETQQQPPHTEQAQRPKRSPRRGRGSRGRGRGPTEPRNQNRRPAGQAQPQLNGQESQPSGEQQHSQATRNARTNGSSRPKGQPQNRISAPKSPQQSENTSSEIPRAPTAPSSLPPSTTMSWASRMGRSATTAVSRPAPAQPQQATAPAKQESLPQRSPNGRRRNANSGRGRGRRGPMSQGNRGGY